MSTYFDVREEHNWLIGGPPDRVLGERDEPIKSRAVRDKGDELREQLKTKTPKEIGWVLLNSYGIKSPRTIAQDKRRTRIIELHRDGLSNKEISEKVGISVDAVRMVVNRNPSPGTQLLLFGLRRFTIKAPPLRIVHIRRHHGKDPAVQLELDFQGVPASPSGASGVPSQKTATGFAALTPPNANKKAA